jgi:hypothetical protein
MTRTKKASLKIATNDTKHQRETLIKAVDGELGFRRSCVTWILVFFS